MRHATDREPGVTCALAAAALFGATTPFAKELSPRIDAWLLAGLLHLGSGLGLSFLRFAGKLGVAVRATPLNRSDWPRLAAAILMGSGVWLHLTEHHEPMHSHEPIEHQHFHEHDGHHPHGHAPGDPPAWPHTHRHRHDLMSHKHPHYPDLHHRHNSWPGRSAS